MSEKNTSVCKAMEVSHADIRKRKRDLDEQVRILESRVDGHRQGINADYDLCLGFHRKVFLFCLIHRKLEINKHGRVKYT